MNRVLASVEGQTEEAFIKEVLQRYLWNFHVDLQPVIITTKRTKQGLKFKGGLFSYEQVRKEIQRLLNDTDVVAVTTMYDLYNLPNDFPSYATLPAASGQAKAIHLEQAFQRAIASPRFRAYLQVHEFEALLFADPERTASLFPEQDLEDRIRHIRQLFPTPEDINDNPENTPSKRILALYPQYDKVFYGSLATLDVGPEVLKAECPHFRDWLVWLESLG